MAWFRPLGVLILLLGLLTLAACSGSAITPGNDNPGTTAGPQNSGAFPSIWELDGMRSTSLVGGGGSQELSGSEYLAPWVFNGTVDGEDMVLDSSVSEPHVAWAVYNFTGLGGTRPTSLNVFATPGGLEQDYYIGIANFTTGRWEWFGPSHVPEFQIDLHELWHRYVSASNNMYTLVITENGNSVTHHKSVLFYEMGDGGVLPGAPHGLVASDGTFAEKVVVTWEQGQGAASYEVFRRRDGSNDGFVKIGVTETTEFADLEVDPGVYYIYKARSVNAAGSSGFSNHDSGYAGQVVGGDCPTELVATDGTYTEKVRVEWIGSPAASYKVYRKADGPHEFELLGVSQGASFNDTTAEPGVTYIYKAAILHEGEVCYSNTDAGYRATGGGDEACPFDVFASDGSYEDKVRLEWGGHAGSFYKIFRKPINGVEYVLIGHTETELSFNDMEAEAGAQYAYKVVLVVDGQFVCHDSDMGFRATSGGDDDCPTQLWASDTYAEKIRLEWHGNATRGYDIYRRVDGENEFTFLAYTTGLSYNDTSAEPGVHYIYKVGLEAPGGFCWSNTEAGLRVEQGDDGCPHDLAASDGTWEAGVHLEWLGSADASHHVYRRHTNGEEWAHIATTNEGLSYLDATAEPGVSYTYKVKHAVSGCPSNEDAGHLAGDE